MSRTAGFNSVDTAALRPESLFATDLLMFIGGGSGGTAGGIKVTTFGLLAFVIWSEMRGETKVNVGHRRVPETNQHQPWRSCCWASARSRCRCSSCWP